MSNLSTELSSFYRVYKREKIKSGGASEKGNIGNIFSELAYSPLKSRLSEI